MKQLLISVISDLFIDIIGELVQQAITLLAQWLQHFI